MFDQSITQPLRWRAHLSKRSPLAPRSPVWRNRPCGLRPRPIVFVQQCPPCRSLARAEEQSEFALVSEPCPRDRPREKGARRIETNHRHSEAAGSPDWPTRVAAPQQRTVGDTSDRRTREEGLALVHRARHDDARPERLHLPPILN